MQKKRKIRISLFSGGTGNDRFVHLLKNIPGVEINIIVNGYDDGKSTRDFCYVDDVAEGIISAAEKYNKSEPVNLASGKETKIKDNHKIL